VKRTGVLRSLALAGALLCSSTHAQEWEPVSDPDELRALFSDTVMTATMADGAKAVARYAPDGTGVLEAWGKTFERTWEIRGQDQVCIGTGQTVTCYRLEQNIEDPMRYRALNLTTGERFELRIDASANTLVVDGSTTASGGAGKPSAEEIAAELANPNTPMASLTFKLQHRLFEGDLPDADDQSSTTLLLQPTFPFALSNGDTIFFRPAIPLQFDQPVFDPAGSDFDSEAGLGDISFDLAYGRTMKSGVLWAGGLISTIPTATDDDLGADRWTLGPEFLIGKLTPKYVLGAFPNHQWDVAGSGDADINLTTIQLFGTYLPGGGWNVGTAPILSFDHEIDEWTIPLNFTFGKTVIWNERPWKLGAEINYYVEQPDAFGPEWMASLNVAPVVENVLARFF
jgi:hypothetical protein